MDYLEAIEEKVGELCARAEASPGLDTWDKAKIEYLEEVRDKLVNGTAPCLVYEQLKAELPALEEEVAHEEAHATFDWYDDHYYEKIYSGRLQACKIAMELYEE